MAEEDHYVKVVVDGVAVPDSSLCGGNPTSSSCTHKVKGTVSLSDCHISSPLFLLGRLFIPQTVLY